MAASSTFSKLYEPVEPSLATMEPLLNAVFKDEATRNRYLNAMKEKDLENTNYVGSDKNWTDFPQSICGFYIEALPENKQVQAKLVERLIKEGATPEQLFDIVDHKEIHPHCNLNLLPVVKIARGWMENQV